VQACLLISRTIPFVSVIRLKEKAMDTLAGSYGCTSGRVSSLALCPRLLRMKTSFASSSTSLLLHGGASGERPQVNSRLSPISHTSNTPVSGISLLLRAFFSIFGGSNTSSSVNTHVPQCMPMAFLHWVSLKISTESKGLACIDEKTQRGSYAPIGIRPKSNGPRNFPICLNAGHRG